jgi:phage shock protein A
MALRMGALYDALRQSPAIPEDLARAAAEEVANYENRLAGIEGRLGVLTCMVATQIVLSLALLGALLGGAR